MASLLSSQSSSNDGPHPSIASRRRPRPSSKHPPLFKMSIFELRKFVEEEKKRVYTLIRNEQIGIDICYYQANFSMKI